MTLVEFLDPEACGWVVKERLEKTGGCVVINWTAAIEKLSEAKNSHRIVNNVIL
jgi:hypothetical protein